MLESGYVRTVVCRTCEPTDVFDVENRYEPFEPSDRLADFECPDDNNGGRDHKLAFWNEGDACPRCGVALKRDPKFMVPAD